MNHSIFLDTSVLNGDYRLRSGSLLHLVRICGISKLKIIAPAVIITDLVAHYRYEFENIINKTQQFSRDLERYIYSGDSPRLELKGQKLLDNYENWLRKRSKSLGIIIRDYPQIKHEQIVKRASTKRKPFKNHDIGYKDTLIWESILEYLRETDDIVFLLSADQDFGESNLHQDLVDDLSQLGMDRKRVTLFKDFEPLLQLLYTTFNVPTMFEDEQRAQWASVSKKQLKSTVPFEDIITKEKVSIERIILVNPHLYTSHPQIERLVSLSDDIALRDVEFTVNYTGGGVWKLDGKALITANAEYRNLIKEEIQPFGRYESINLEVKFTLYYDYSKEIVTDTIIKHVNRLVA